MAVSREYQDFVLDLLAPLSPVGFRMPSVMLFSSSNCFCRNGRLLPGRPPGGQASRRDAFGCPFG